MYQATVDEAVKRYGNAEPLFNYRWEHVRAVHTLALKLARLTGADMEIVEAAAWLHDVAKEQGRAHPQAGAAYARRFLPQTDFPSEKIAAVAEAIADHMGLWRDEPLERLESQVLWDADKLAKLGLTAAFHWTGMNFAEADALTMEEIIARGEDVDWQKRTVRSMHTAPARRAAVQRLNAFNELWENLASELNGDDLYGA
jgi:uncharacterized protein